MTQEQRIDEMIKSFEEIADLVQWACDTEADASDLSPVDQAAHVNGLVYQICQRMIGAAVDHGS